MLRDLLSGFIKIHILHHAGQQPVHSLERAGYLTSEKHVVGGRQRRYYTLTPAGEAALAEARAGLAELVAEVLEMPT
jgi:DNA-binding PadR family transcriptional regulator